MNNALKDRVMLYNPENGREFIPTPELEKRGDLLKVIYDDKGVRTQLGSELALVRNSDKMIEQKKYLFNPENKRYFLWSDTLVKSMPGLLSFDNFSEVGLEEPEGTPKTEVQPIKEPTVDVVADILESASSDSEYVQDVVDESPPSEGAKIIGEKVEGEDINLDDLSDKALLKFAWDEYKLKIGYNAKRETIIAKIYEAANKAE